MSQNADFCCDCGGPGCNNARFLVEFMGVGQCGGFQDLLCFDDCGFELGTPNGFCPASSACDHVAASFYSGFKLRVEYGTFDPGTGPTYAWTEVRATCDTTIGEPEHIEVEQGTGTHSDGIVFQWTRNADGSVSQSGGVGAIALAVSNTNVASHTSTHYLRTDATMPPDSHYKTEVTLDGAVAVGACITDAKTFCDSVSISGNATVTIWDGSTVQTNVPASPLRIRKFYARRPGGFTVINGINGTTYTDGVGNALGVPDGPFVNAATSPECRYVAGQGNIGAHDPNTFPIDIEDNGSGLPLFQSICNPVYLNTINVAAATQTKLAFIMPRWCIEKVQAQIIKCDGSNTLMDWTTVPTDQCQIGAAAGRIAHCHSEPDGNNQIGTITNVDGCQSGGCTGIIWLFTYHDMQTFGWMELDETTCGDCTVICNNLAP